VERPPETALETPPGFEITDSAESFAVEMRWFGAQHVAVALIGIMCVGVGWIESTDPRGFGSVALGSGFLVGALFLYLALAGVLNATRVTVKAGALAVRFGPLPWRRGRSYGPGALKGVEVRERQSQSARSAGPVTYEVWTRDHGDVARRLIGGLPSIDAAEWLQHQIELRL
jgi:hypothetical protein